jgi:hypothetical protein
LNVYAKVTVGFGKLGSPSATQFNFLSQFAECGGGFVQGDGGFFFGELFGNGCINQRFGDAHRKAMGIPMKQHQQRDEAMCFFHETVMHSIFPVENFKMAPAVIFYR